MNISFRSIALVATQYISIIAILLSTSNVARSQAESTYNPAVLKLIYTLNPAQSESSFLDTILIPAKGDPSAHRIEIDPKRFARLLSQFYSQVASLRTINTSDETSPSRELYSLLFGPLHESFLRQKITTLLISANTGLQAVPFSALHDGEEWFGTRFSFSLTPSLSLIKHLQGEAGASRKSFLAGSSIFDGLAPLPMVNQELKQISQIRAGNAYLNEQFTRQVLDSSLSNPDVDYVHLSTHAEFLPGGPQKSKIYLGKGSLSIKEFSGLRLSRDDNPFELFTLSACRTALGDRDSELGLAGLALQVGAKTAIGSLWYVDDLATTIFFIRFYRLLDQGLPKGEAMRQVRSELSKNQIEIKNQSLYDRDGEILIEDLTPSQTRKLNRRLDHPFFWAAPIMLGLPW